MLKSSIQINRDVCNTFRLYLPQAKTDIRQVYDNIVARYMNAKTDQIIVDLGGGKGCSFAKYKEASVRARIIAVDICESELKQNSEVDETRVADVVGCLPFEDEEADIVASRWVLEHVSDLDSFVVESKRILKKGGYSIHLGASKFAPFAVINRILPNELSKKILYFLGNRGFSHFNNSGFETFYDKCYYSGVKSVFEKNGFEIVDIQVSYYQSGYFSFFLPLFLVSALYEMLLKATKAHDLGAYILVVARKK
jgi:ubiquinone/menaquinone biosynthesis C-methylase UbiE